MTEESSVDQEKRDLDLYMLSAPSASSFTEGSEASRQSAHRNQTWWTVDAKAPEPDRSVDAGSTRVITILLSLLGMHLSTTWKVLQL